MTSAYAAIANGGMAPTPMLIRRVETTSGEVLFTGGQPAQRAISENTAFLMTSMLADVINSGTAWTARRTGFTKPAAGKTGTTNDYHDAWFVGYTPHIVAGVWVGYDQPRTIIAGGYAAELAVPLWARFMMSATRNDDSDWFNPPSSITSATICRLSGKLANDGCRAVPTTDDDGSLSIKSMAYTEYFVRGTEPTDYCPLHGNNGLLTLATSGAAPSVVAPGAVSSPAGHAAAPASTARVEPQPTPTDHPEEQKSDKEKPKKKGFWGRLFGR
jgi:penicillin-binding protein 1A